MPQYFPYEYQCRSCEHIFGLKERMSLTPCPMCGERARRYYGNHSVAYKQQSNNNATTKRNG